MNYEDIEVEQIVVTPLGKLKQLKFHARSTMQKCIDIDEELNKLSTRGIYFSNLTVLKDRSIQLTAYELQNIIITMYEPNINTDNLKITEIYYEVNKYSLAKQINKIILEALTPKETLLLKDLGMREIKPNTFELLNIELKYLINNSITFNDWLIENRITYYNDDIEYISYPNDSIKLEPVENMSLKTWKNKVKLLDIADEYIIQKDRLVEYLGNSGKPSLPPVRHITNTSYRDFSKSTIECLVIPSTVLSLNTTMQKVNYIDLSKAHNLYSTEKIEKYPKNFLKNKEYIVDLRNIAEGIVVMNPPYIKANALYFRRYTNMLDRYSWVIIRNGIDLGIRRED